MSGGGNEGRRMLPEEVIIALMVIAMVVLVMVQVLSRYVFHTSLSHTEEIVRYLFVWATFIGVPTGIARGRHLSAGVLPGLSGGVFQRALRAFTWAAGMLFSILLGWNGARIVLLQARTGQTTAALGMPMWVVGLVVPVAAVLMVARLVVMVKGRGRGGHG